MNGNVLTPQKPSAPPSLLPIVLAQQNQMRLVATSIRGHTLIMKKKNGIVILLRLFKEHFLLHLLPSLLNINKTDQVPQPLREPSLLAELANYCILSGSGRLNTAEPLLVEGGDEACRALS